MANVVVIGVGGVAVFTGLNIYYQNAKFYNDFVMPVIHKLDPETAHCYSLKVLSLNLLPRRPVVVHKELETTVFGLRFTSPVGLAAGYDKHGEAVAGCLNLGFAFVEVGSVTPLPQEGNEKPRIFRLEEDEAVINRCGFNSHGHKMVSQRLLKQKRKPGIMGLNIGQNKNTADPVQDYVAGVVTFGHLADYLVVNVSSPNTPGLRSLQHKRELTQLLEQVLTSRDQTNKNLPILLKIAPDLTPQEKKDIAEVISSTGCIVDGLIVSNTTVSRPSSLLSHNRVELGGLSGSPLRCISTETIKEMYILTNGKIPIIGCGGIFTGNDAYEKIRAGASLVQLYTSLVYCGPPVVEKITLELKELLCRDGYKNVQDAVGVDTRRK